MDCEGQFLTTVEDKVVTSIYTNQVSGFTIKLYMLFMRVMSVKWNRGMTCIIRVYHDLKL